MTYDYRVDVLRKNIVIGSLTCTDVQIHYDSTADIKRSASITADTKLNKMQSVIKKTGSATTITFNLTTNLYSDRYTEIPFEFNDITDRLRPVLIIDGTEYNQGTFIISSKPTTVNGEYVSSTLECYDETYILDQSATSSRMYFASGSNYIDSIESILVGSGLSNIIADANTGTMNADHDWDLGTTKLEIINQLLDEINYEHVYTDGNGYIHLQKKSTSFVPKWIYRQNDQSIMSMEMTKQKDIYNIPNVFVGVVTSPDVSTLTFKKTNDNVQSELSTVNRGYELCKVYEFNDISTEAELESYINDEYLKSLMATETITFSTAPDGSHGNKESIQIDTDEISGLYQETKWDLTFGSDMTHTAERVVYE